MKKLVIAIITLMVSNYAFAAGTLNCVAEDGSAIRAIVNGEQGSVPHQVEYSIRGSKFKAATVLQYISGRAFFNGSVQEEKVETLAIRDTKTGELAMVISKNTLMDKTGTYSVTCSFGY